MNRTVLMAAAVAAWVYSFPTLAGERVLQFRSAEDPTSPPDPAVCATAPFHVNLRLGASLFSYELSESGVVERDEARKIGNATACARLTDLTFPPGLQQQFFVRLNLAEGSLTALGTCTLISNDVPRKGLVLAGCNLLLMGAPAGVLGGAVTSLTTFNPFRLSGFATGSFWTVQLYDTATGAGDSDSDRTFEWVEDTRAAVTD